MASIDADSGSETQRIIDDPSRGFLGHLTPPVFQHYPYRGRAQFENDFKRACDTTDHTVEWFLVTAVDNKTFTTEFLEAEEPPFSRWCAYDPALKLILINMVKSAPHETASGIFGLVLQEALVPIGMQRCLLPIGSITQFATIGGKEPDLAWQPSRLPRGRSAKWPSAVLEVAYSETQAKLRSDVRYWLRGPEGEVKTILTIRISRNEPKIIIERWESDGNSQGHREQQIVISKRRNGKITIAGAPLVLDFERLFLRAPTTPRERNIEIGNEKLEFVATRVWVRQQF
ncbi:hypothetical protein BDW59DRAFT_167514 [Aspergillus cavernicola]|uniref:Uncharacterized protein n=1 Tax=Aspergillus cavernicola TaxID=176166 RepID=A0ABR4HFC6_9EURO